jgi:phosphatidate cytidylyltransferase
MLRQRLIYGYLIGAIAVGILAYGDKLLFIFLMGFAIWMMIEFYQLTGLREDKGLFPMRRWGYFLGIIILALVYLRLTIFFDLAIVTFIIAAFIYRMANYENRSIGFLRDLATSILGGIYIGGFLSYFLRIRVLGIKLQELGIIPVEHYWLGKHSLGFLGDFTSTPNWLILLPILGSWGYDFSAFFTGILLGKTPLAPAISPKKTIEGMVGGLIGCGSAMVLFGWLIGVDARFYLFLFILGLVLGTFSQLGDL